MEFASVSFLFLKLIISCLSALCCLMTQSELMQKRRRQQVQYEQQELKMVDKPRQHPLYGH